MNPNQVYYSSNAPGSSRGRRLLIVFGLLALVGGAIALFLILGNSNNGNSGDKNNGGKEQKDSGVILDLTTVNDPRFIAPSNMKGYNRDNSFAADVYDYTTSDNACNLQFGVVNGDDLPGTTMESIASAHLGASAEFGAVGGDPVDGKDLVLKAVSGGQRYALRTFNFSYSRDGVNYKAAYSIALLAGGNRAYVRTYCANTGDPVSTSAFNKINSKAKEITVQLD
jgi:hypothetical protein